MNKNVIISVKGTQTMPDQEKENLELITEGKYYKKGSTYYITYKESQVTGMEGTTTTLKVSDGEVTLMRFGTVNSQMIFKKGEKSYSYYDTAYGAFTIAIYSNDVDVKVDDNGGEIRVDYTLEIDNNSLGKNKFYMNIREAGRNDDNRGTSVMQH